MPSTVTSASSHRLRVIPSRTTPPPSAPPPATARRQETAPGRCASPAGSGAVRPDAAALHAWMLSLQEDEAFYRKLQKLYARAASVAEWGWEPLYEDERMRCGLLWLGPDGALPLHDHPGMVSVLVGLVGEIEMERYDAPRAPVPSEGHVLLSGGTRTCLRRDDLSVIDGPRGNIHGLRNTTAHPAVALDALWHGGRPVCRHLFFPTGSRSAARLSAVMLRECRVRTLGDQLPGLTPLRGPSGG